MKQLSISGRYFVFLFLIGLLVSCSSESASDKVTDTPVNGRIAISVDESFQPVIDQQIRMYEASYPGTTIQVQYKSEADCLQDLLKRDSVRLVIVSRLLHENEQAFLKSKLGYSPASAVLAFDGIALVQHPSDQDTMFSLERLQSELSGRAKATHTYLMDGYNATSTVSYIRDSVMRGLAFDSSAVRALKNTKEVLEYVATHPGSLGFVGLGWIGDRNDTAQTAMLNRLKFGYLQCEQCPGRPFFQPLTENFNGGCYQFTRKLCFILKENHTGLGTGFTSFLRYERGQLIFKNAFLGTTMNFQVRDVRLR
ncbi:MAG: substrate-binding domain-containing protein [Ferruginibacter sp.]